MLFMFHYTHFIEFDIRRQWAPETDRQNRGHEFDENRKFVSNTMDAAFI